MASKNIVHLVGWVVKSPKITRDDNGEYVEAYAIIRTIRGFRSNGQKIGHLKYDNQPIVTSIPSQIQEIDQNWEVGSIVQIKGFLASRNIIQRFDCPTCGEEVTRKSVITYVQPIWSRIEKKGVDEDNIWKELKVFGEISNQCVITGTLCVDPAPLGYEVETNIPNTNYIVAIKRAYRVRGTRPEIEQQEKVDYLPVKTFANQAISDTKRLRKGSLVVIEGAIQTRWGYVIKAMCDMCGSSIAVSGTTSEIIPYSVEYANLRYENSLEQQIESEREADENE